tara:strand:- start:412 stop:1317 length:906 start_codon:yes stop_codon:yes gene_type:complete
MPAQHDSTAAHQPPSDKPFLVGLGLISSIYVLLLIGLLLGDIAYMATGNLADQVGLPGWLEWARTPLRPVLSMVATLGKPEIRYSVQLTMISCLFSALLSLFVAVPTSYLLSRHDFPGKNLLDAILDIPIVLPPLVVGLSLLILFQFAPDVTIGDNVYSIRNAIVFQVPAVVLAQFMVAAAFAVRVMRATFDQVDPRPEQVALTLGCNQAQAFWRVVLPQCNNGMLTAGTLAWARSLGEFGPLLIFAGATRMKTEVLSTTVFLELSIGNLEGAVAVSLLMVLCAVVVLVIARIWGSRGLSL